jgi:hypothetical protein
VTATAASQDQLLHLPAVTGGLGLSHTCALSQGCRLSASGHGVHVVAPSRRGGCGWGIRCRYRVRHLAISLCRNGTNQHPLSLATSLTQPNSLDAVSSLLDTHMATLSTITEEQLSLDTHMATLPTE